MSVNKFRPHVFLIPEDDADRQLAIGFLGHFAVDDRVVDMRDPAGGWIKVLDVFEEEYLMKLRGSDKAHLVMLIDFDDKDIAGRRDLFEQRIPDDVKPRVFVIGSKVDPEALQRELGMTREQIGKALAEDCLKKDFELWRHAHLVHNGSELERMSQVVKPILFQHQ
jgi:hypothetical protein